MSFLICSWQRPKGCSCNSKTRKAHSQREWDRSLMHRVVLVYAEVWSSITCTRTMPCLVPFRSPKGLITDTWNLWFDQAQVFFSSQPNNHKLIWLLPLDINISAFACCLICLSVWILIVTQEQVMKQNFRWSFCRGSNTVRTTFQRRCQSRCGTLRWSSSMKITGQGLKGWEEGPFPRNMVWLCSPKGGPILAPCSKSSGKNRFLSELLTYC